MVSVDYPTNDFECLIMLGEQLSCSGVIGIVVLGMLLSNYKTAISSEAAIFMEKSRFFLLDLCESSSLDSGICLY